MSGEAEPPDTGADAETGADLDTGGDPASERTPLPEHVRRRLDAVFGDVLPDTTRDERDPGSGAEPSADDRFLADRPPHHDRER